MKMTCNLSMEMDYVKDLFQVLHNNRFRRGDVFQRGQLHGQPHFGYPRRQIADYYYTCSETLEAMERRGIIVAIDKKFTWEDGSEVTLDNIHAGRVYETITYKVVIDNMTDYFKELFKSI